MRLLKWILVSSVMGVLAACASGEAVTAPPVPTLAPVEASATPLVAATTPVDAATPIATEPLPGAPLAKSTFIFLWEPG